MATKIYVASSWRNTYQQDTVKLLRESGHAVYDFRGAGDGWDSSSGGGGFSWGEVDPDYRDWPEDVQKYLEGLNHPRAVEGYNRDKDALDKADVCVYVMPCGVSASIEMGYAAGAGKLVVCYVPGIREPDLMIKVGNVVTSDMLEVLRVVGNWKPHVKVSTQKRIADWMAKVGVFSSTARRIERMEEEFEEMLNTDSPEAMLKELVDVTINAFSIAISRDFDLLNGVHAKLDINEVREWHITPTGEIYHKKPDDTRIKK